MNGCSLKVKEQRITVIFQASNGKRNPDVTLVDSSGAPELAVAPPGTGLQVQVFEHLVQLIKPLEYMHMAKRLNSRQARWALFFTGSCNGKPDALS